jgi:hypothetical protein
VKSPKGELECSLASAKASRQFPTLVGVLLLNKQQVFPTLVGVLLPHRQLRKTTLPHRQRSPQVAGWHSPPLLQWGWEAGQETDPLFFEGLFFIIFL